MNAWIRTFERLDRISRGRALTNDESFLLEAAIHRIDTLKKPRGKSGVNAWSPDQELCFSKLLLAGMSPRRAGIAIGKTGPAGVGKHWRMVRAGEVRA